MSDDIWVYAEADERGTTRAAFELLAAARGLASRLGGRVAALALGPGAASRAGELFARGAQIVIASEGETFARCGARPYARAVARLAREHSPSIMLYPATPEGRDVAPRVACILGTGLTADATGLEIDESGEFVQIKPSFGGDILSRIAIPRHRPQMATVRPGIFRALPAEPNAGGEIVDGGTIERDDRYELLSSEPRDTEGRSIADCDVIISAGRGVKRAETLEALRRAAALLDGELACSRPLADDGTMPRSRQIGASGTTVRPKAIVNFGISGTAQYTVGMDGSELIVSVDHDPSAQIFDISHVGAICDVDALAPALADEIARRTATA